MAEEKATLREVQWRHVCPWLALFRSFGIALDLKKLVLAAAGMLLMSAGWWLLAGLFGLSGNEALTAQVDDVKHWPWDDSQRPVFVVAKDATAAEVLDELATRGKITPVDARSFESRVGEKRGLAIVESLVRTPLSTIAQLATHWRIVLRPLVELKRPFQSLFGREAGFAQAVFAFACGLWSVAVWAVFGGAITRIAAVQFARDEKIGLKDAVKFSVGKFLSYAGAPVIPLFFITFFLILCAAGGLISALLSWLGVPGFGALFAGSLWILPLLAGFAMTIIALLWAIGWPLMFATISAEGSDSFDALSRSYAYAFQRPWHYLFYALVVAMFGSLCSFFVLLFADVVVHMARWAVAWGDVGLGQLSTLLDQLFYYAPAASGWADTQSPVVAPTGVTWVGAVCTGVWLYLVFLLLAGFFYSYFWSASTVIYFLLRREVDNTEMQEVYLEGAEDDFEAPVGEHATSPVVTPAVAPEADKPQEGS